MKRTITICCLAYWLSISLAMADGVAPDAVSLDLPFKTQLERVIALSKANKAKELQDLAEALLSQKSSYSPEEKRRLLVDLCTTLASTDFGEKSGRSIADKLALRALAADPQMDVWSQNKLIMCFALPRLEEGGLTRENIEKWTSERKQRADVIASLWQKLSEELRGFDPQKIDFVYQVPIPPETGLMQGVAPEAIKDPVIREKYSRQVAENLAKAEIYYDKHEKSVALKQLLSTAEVVLVSSYTSSPYNSQELITLLKPIDPQNEVKKRIVDTVEKVTQAAVTGLREDPFPVTSKTN